MFRRGSTRIGARFLGAAALLALAAPAALGSVFDALPHLKRPPRPVCSHYGPCYGYYPVAYRQWPVQCLSSSALPPRPNPYILPSPGIVPEEPPPETPPGPTSGILFELEFDPAPVIPVAGRAERSEPRRPQTNAAQPR